jgi:xylulokinase
MGIEKDLVIGIDSSTQSTKAIAWNAQGRAVAEGRADISLLNPQMFHFEQSSDEWRQSCIVALQQLTKHVDPARIAAISISNQRETISFLNEEFQSIRPAMIWLDERSREEVDQFSAEIGPELIHRITGKPPDVTPVVYRLAWLRNHEPGVLNTCRWIADVHAFIAFMLTGRCATSWASADPLGIFDMESKQWSQPILKKLGIDSQQLPDLVPPGGEIGVVKRETAEVTGLAPGIPVVAGGGDGQIAGLGTGCIVPDHGYLTIGTGMAVGVWSPEYLCDRAYRTMGSCTGEGYILETVVRSGAFLINWFVDQFTPGRKLDPAIFEKLERECARIPVGSDGLLAVPYWSGVMSPYWNSNARGIMIGLSGNHRPAHVYRAILEGLALEQALQTELVESSGDIDIAFLYAIGGGAASALLCQIFSNAMGKPLRCLDTVEASSLGAAMIAAKSSGWFETYSETVAAMGGHVVAEYGPDEKAREQYLELSSIYRDIYPANLAINRKLMDFVDRQKQGSTSP